MNAKDEPALTVGVHGPMLAQWRPALEGVFGINSAGALDDALAACLIAAGIGVQDRGGRHPVFVMPSRLEARVSALEANVRGILGWPASGQPLVPNSPRSMRLGCSWVAPTLGRHGNRLSLRSTVGVGPPQEQVLVLEARAPSRAVVVSQVLLATPEERGPNLRFGSAELTTRGDRIKQLVGFKGSTIEWIEHLLSNAGISVLTRTPFPVWDFKSGVIATHREATWRVGLAMSRFDASELIISISSEVERADKCEISVRVTESGNVVVAGDSVTRLPS